jgi:hypothetical protein
MIEDCAAPMFISFVTSCHRGGRMIAASLFLVLSCCAAQAAEPLTTYKAVLLQPGKVYEKRVASADALASYINSVDAVVKSTVEHAGQQPRASGYIVVALRPGQRSHVWLDFDEPVADSLRSELSAKIGSVMPIHVKEGTIAFALKVGLWGGTAPSRAKPEPKEWHDAQQKSLEPLDTEELLDAVWKD